MTQAGEHPRVREFLKQLRALYADVRTWLPHELRVREDTIRLHEEAFGRYEAPMLKMTYAGGSAVAALEPVGASIIGAKARVDLKGAADAQPILYLLAGGPALRVTVTSTAETLPDQRIAPVFTGVTREGWYWVDEKHPRQAHPLDHDAFLKLLRVIADYGEAQPARPRPAGVFNDARLDLFKTIAGPDRIGQAKQVKQFRDWIVHRNPKKGSPPQADPQTTYALLSEVIEKIRRT